jgi:hypothetical protein
MVPIISLLVILTLSVLVTRIATIALAHTGLSKESARFQARSAFTGVGFTTNESEKVVNHPVRRRILLLLMLLGNAGIVTAVSSFILTFIDLKESGSLFWKMVLFVFGLAALLTAAHSRWLDRQLHRLISWALRRFTRLDVKDYQSLLHLARDYRVSEHLVREGDWLADRTLADSHLRAEGLLVLGIARSDGTYIGAPQGDSVIRAGDTLLLYGKVSFMEALDRRQKGLLGDIEHEAAVKEQKKEEERERREDPETYRKE